MRALQAQEEAAGLRAEVGVLAGQLRDAQNHIAAQARSSEPAIYKDASVKS